jgi:predicted SnoaL-like aldol condensation-catalyzing enzyme
MQSNKQKVHTLLKGLETGDPDAALVVNEQVYVQHNPHTQEGNEGLAVLFKRLAKTEPKVRTVRAFEDGDFVFAHMEYDFSSVKVAFEVFRFENGLAVEHWDNIQPMQQPNHSGRTMLDGNIELQDLAKTENNRLRVKEFVETVLINQKLENLVDFVNNEKFVQHSPNLTDGIEALRIALLAKSASGQTMKYARLHRVLAQGNFVLSVSEGSLNGVHSAFYDLYRMQDNRLVEHWDTIEPIPPVSEWKNTNGKF